MLKRLLNLRLTFVSSSISYRLARVQGEEGLLLREGVGEVGEVAVRPHGQVAGVLGPEVDLVQSVGNVRAVGLHPEHDLGLDVDAGVGELVLLHGQDRDAAVLEVCQRGEGADLLVEELLPLPLLALEVEVHGVAEARDPDELVDHHVLPEGGGGLFAPALELETRVK